MSNWGGCSHVRRGRKELWRHWRSVVKRRGIGTTRHSGRINGRDGELAASVRAGIMYGIREIWILLKGSIMSILCLILRDLLARLHRPRLLAGGMSGKSGIRGNMRGIIGILVVDWVNRLPGVSRKRSACWRHTVFMGIFFLASRRI